jgi:hypothetical protein
MHAHVFAIVVASLQVKVWGFPLQSGLPALSCPRLLIGQHRRVPCSRSKVQKDEDLCRYERKDQRTRQDGPDQTLPHLRLSLFLSPFASPLVLPLLNPSHQGLSSLLSTTRELDDHSSHIPNFLQIPLLRILPLFPPFPVGLDQDSMFGLPAYTTYPPALSPLVPLSRCEASTVSPLSAPPTRITWEAGPRSQISSHRQSCISVTPVLAVDRATPTALTI